MRVCPIESDVEKWVALVHEFAADNLTGEAAQRIGARLHAYFDVISAAAGRGMTVDQYVRPPMRWIIPDADVADAAAYSKRKR